MNERQIYQIPRGRSLGVCLHRDVGDQTKVSAQLVTFSTTDVEIVVCSEIEAQETVRVGLRHHPRFAVDLPGKVICARRTVAGEWLVQCALESQVSESIVSGLVEAGLLEPCESQDELLPLAAEVQWESDSRKAPATLHNFNASGFCVASARPADEGDRLHLLLEKETGQRLRIKATALWHRQTAGEGFLLGCSFESVREYFRLRSFLFRPSPQVEEPWESVPGLTYVTQVATVAALCCNYLHLL